MKEKRSQIPDHILPIKYTIIVFPQLFFFLKTKYQIDCPIAQSDKLKHYVSSINHMQAA